MEWNAPAIAFIRADRSTCPNVKTVQPIPNAHVVTSSCRLSLVLVLGVECEKQTNAEKFIID